MSQGGRVLTNDTITTRGEEAKDTSRAPVHTTLVIVVPTLLVFVKHLVTQLLRGSDLAEQRVVFRRRNFFRPTILWHQRAICPVYPSQTSASEQRLQKLGVKGCHACWCTFSLV